MGWDWELAFLFGALVIVTGPTVVTPLLRRIRIRHRLETFLESEGVLIDGIGAIAAIYTTWGGLKAVAWADLFQGSALLLGGLLTMILGFKAVGGVDAFFELGADKLHTVLPWNHPEMPWVAVFIGGLWIPNLFYWGLNQFITQRTLGARSLKDGQRGIVLAAALKLIIPFIIVFPGIMAAELYGDTLANPDQAYPVMIRDILPAGLTGIMFAALFGAVMSSLDSMLNSASTIFTMAKDAVSFG